MDLYILRHGKAEEAGPGGDDAGRRLTKKGREEIAAAGRWLAARDPGIGLIAASPLLRAQETAAIVSRCLDREEPPATWKVLAPGGSPEQVCRQIAQHAECRAVLLAGHEPLLSALVGFVIAGSGSAAIAMQKGSLAKIRHFSPGPPPAGELHWLVPAALMAAER